MINDEDYQFNLGFAKSRIKNWKSWYCRKNSKLPVEIKVRCNHSADQPIFWQYFLEISRGGKMIEQMRIKQEAYDTLTLDDTLPKSQYTGIVITTLHSFNPTI